MRTWSFETKIKLIGILLAGGVVVHLSLGFIAGILNRESRGFRFRPRYVVDTEVRGKTYHTHSKRPVDLAVKENYERRRHQVETFRPHLVARRDILDYDEPTAPKHDISKSTMYKALGGEVRSLELKCGSCAVVGSAGTLTSAGSGQSINNADCVFRLGLAPVNDFKVDVGLKTNVRVVDGKSFGEILRRPQKLTTGGVSSPIWIVYDHFDVDAISKFIFKLPQIKRQNSAIKIYTITRKAETEALYSMKLEGAKLGYKMTNKKPSTLWYTMQAVSQAGCQKVDIYGVPDPKYCKTCTNGQKTKSRYWGKGSPLFCIRGKDAGTENDSAQQQFISMDDRRALLALATINPTMNISLHAPTWPQAKTGL